jgi:O-succinylbenzoic acid--CoA ligase
VIVPDWLHVAARARPDSPALAVPGRAPISYVELEVAVARLVASLAEAGVGEGDRVVSRLGVTPESVALLHALPRLRAVFVPLDPRAPMAEVRHAIARVGGKWLALGPDAEDGPPGTGAGTVRIPAVGDGSAALPATDAEPAPVRSPTVDLSRPHSVIFTSGTSGVPSPVVLTAGNLEASARANAERLGHVPEDRWLSCLPLHHVGGLSIPIRSAIFAACAELHRGFDAQAVADAIAAGHVTLVSLVPTTLSRVLDALSDRAVPVTLRAVLLGGAAAPAGLLRRALDLRLPVAPTYGLTEAASQVATAAPGDPVVAEGKVGRPVGSTRVRVVKADGTEARAGESGEVQVKGPTVSPGRLSPDGVLEPLAPSGWLRTGDLGSIDASGNLLVLGRRDDVIVSGGENVSPEEVEAVLLDHPAIAEAGVAGLPDEEWGQVVAAWIVPRGAPPTLAEIREACRARLSRAKLPRRLFVVDALPRTAIGKLRRSRLRDAVARSEISRAG